VNYKVVVRSRAQIEIAEIMRGYEERGEGLGSYFLLCLDASLEALSRFPTAPRIVRHEYRRFFVRKFPVAVYYIVKDDNILVDVVEPMMRDPSRLERKLKKG